MWCANLNSWRVLPRAVVLLALFMTSFATMAAAASSLTEDLLDVQFVDDNSGWASGRWGTVMHTSDGGRTWLRQRTGVDYTLASIHFADANNGWAVGDEGTIIHTADGGKTWVKQSSPVRLFLTRVHFRNAKVGWAVGEHTHILHTSDGGATWTIQFTSGDFILKSLSFADDNTGWAVGEYGFIFRTTNGGKTWVRQAGHYGMSEQTGEIVGGNFLFDVHAVNNRTAWAVGIDGYVVRTEDGGATWREINSGAPKTQLFAVSASSSGSVVIAGNGIMMVSTDAGHTWKHAKAEPTVNYGWLYRLARRPSGFAAVGWQGAIYLGDAGANAWRAVGK